MTTPATALAEQIEQALKEPNNGWFVANVQRALENYRASQVEGERVRAAWSQAPDGKWAVNGWSGATDRETRGTSIDCNPTMADDADFVTGYVEFTLPPRTTPPTVEGSVVQ